MKTGYTIENHIWEGATYFLLFNWEYFNLVALHGRRTKDRDNNEVIGV